MTTSARRGFRVSVLLVMSVLLVPVGAEAQNRGDRRQDRREMEQRFRRQMARMIQERLGLDDAQSATLSEVVRGFESRRRELGRAELAVRRRVEALIEAGGEDDVEARALLDRAVELRAEEAQLFAEEQEALLEVLTPVQVLQLQSLREELGRRIRSLRGGDGARRRGRGGGDGDRSRRSGGVGHGAAWWPVG